MQFVFEPFHHVEDDGAALIVHESGKRSLFEAGEVKGGELAATRETVFVYAAFIALEEVAGNGAHQHPSAKAFFNKAVFELSAAEIKMDGELVGFLLFHVYHETFAAVAAVRAVDQRSDFSVQPGHQGVDFCAVMALQEAAKGVVFRLLSRSKIADSGQIRL